MEPLLPDKKDCLREREYVVEYIKDEMYLQKFTEDEKNEFVGQVKYYLTAVAKAQGFTYGDSTREAKAQISLKLFQFLSSPKSIRFMKDNKKFGITVLAKLNEMRVDFKAMPKYNVQFQIISETISRRMN